MYPPTFPTLFEVIGIATLLIIAIVGIMLITYVAVVSRKLQ